MNHILCIRRYNVALVLPGVGHANATKIDLYILHFITINRGVVQSIYVILLMNKELILLHRTVHLNNCFNQTVGFRQVCVCMVCVCACACACASVYRFVFVWWKLMVLVANPVILSSDQMRNTAALKLLNGKVNAKAVYAIVSMDVHFALAKYRGRTDSCRVENTNMENFQILEPLYVIQ